MSRKGKWSSNRDLVATFGINAPTKEQCLKHWEIIVIIEQTPAEHTVLAQRIAL